VTHVLGAFDVAGAAGAAGDIELYVCRYEVPEKGQRVDLDASVVGPRGIGLGPIGGSLGVLERWRIEGETLSRTQLDDRFVEYPRIDGACEGASFRYGYCLEVTWGDDDGVPGASGQDQPQDSGAAAVSPRGLLKFDLGRDDVVGWNPEPGRKPSEPVFVRAGDGHSDEEGWLLTVVDDPDRGASDLYVLDASTLGRRRPEAVIHLPERLPIRSHGEWVPADRYR
jgi:carotenoid cleavage dioxygenase